jgi:hypothetical protein
MTRSGRRLIPLNTRLSLKKRPTRRKKRNSMLMKPRKK